jgi:hypothetical protein
VRRVVGLAVVLVALVAATGVHPAPSRSDRSVTEPAPVGAPTLTLRVGKTVMWITQRTRVRGRLSGVSRVAGRRVVLELDDWPFGRFRRAGLTGTRRSGRYGFVLRPARNVRVRVRVGRLRSRIVTVWADRPWTVRPRGRGGPRPRLRFTLGTPPRDKARRKRVSAYLARTDTDPWQRVDRRRFQRLRRFSASVTLRFPPGTLGRGDHWMLCQPERRPDAYGRPTEIERRCGAAEIPRGI